MPKCSYSSNTLKTSLLYFPINYSIHCHQKVSKNFNFLFHYFESFYWQGSFVTWHLVKQNQSTSCKGQHVFCNFQHHQLLFSSLELCTHLFQVANTQNIDKVMMKIRKVQFKWIGNKIEIHNLTCKRNQFKA